MTETPESNPTRSTRSSKRLVVDAASNVAGAVKKTVNGAVNNLHLKSLGHPAKTASSAITQSPKNNWKKLKRAYTAKKVLKQELEDTQQVFGKTQEAVANEEAKSRLRLKRAFILNPDSRFRRTWDILQTFILLYVAVMVPYRVGFKASAEGPIYWVELLQDLYFVCDVFLNFFTGYPDPEDDGACPARPSRQRPSRYLHSGAHHGRASRC